MDLHIFDGGVGLLPCKRKIDRGYRATEASFAKEICGTNRRKRLKKTHLAQPEGGNNFLLRKIARSLRK